MNIEAMIDDRVKVQVERQLEEKLAPLNALLNQIWEQMQAGGGIPIADPSIPDPAIPDPSIPDPAIPDTPIPLPPIPGLGGGAAQTAHTSQSKPQSEDDAMRQQLERSAIQRQGQQAAAISRRIALIEARIAQKLASQQL